MHLRNLLQHSFQTMFHGPWILLLSLWGFILSHHSETQKYLQLCFGKKEVKNSIKPYKWAYIRTCSFWTFQRCKDKLFILRGLGNFMLFSYLSPFFQCFWCETAGTSHPPCLADHLLESLLFKAYVYITFFFFCFSACTINVCKYQQVQCLLSNELAVFKGRDKDSYSQMWQTWFCSRNYFIY